MGSCEESNIKKSYIVQTLEGFDILSACTAIYTDNLYNCTGDTIFIQSDILSANTITANTYYGDGSNLTGISGITDNYVSGGTYNSGATTLDFVGTNAATTFSVDVAGLRTSFTGNTSGTCITDLYIDNLYGCSPITVHDDFIPDTDNTLKLGTQVKRYRELNAYSGNTTVWYASQKVETPSLDLGLDSSGNTRIITADNSIIQFDVLKGGTY
jgi:hypothetical protein